MNKGAEWRGLMLQPVNLWPKCVRRRGFSARYPATSFCFLFADNLARDSYEIDLIGKVLDNPQPIEAGYVSTGETVGRLLVFK